MPLTKEEAQQWLEKEQYNILQNGEPSSDVYTIDQIRSIIDTPMNNGKSMLSNFLDWNNARAANLLIEKYGAKVKAEHFEIVREKLQNPLLANVAQEMLEVLRNAQEAPHIEEIPDAEVKNFEMAREALLMPPVMEIPRQDQAMILPNAYAMEVSHEEKMTITKEDAQQWLENEQYNILQNGQPSSDVYTIDQIRSIIDTPMNNGKSMLSNFLDWNNARAAELIIKKYSAKVEVEHFKIAREKLSTLPHTAHEMLEVLKNAQINYLGEIPRQDQAMILSHAIKYCPRLADQLLSEGYVIPADTIIPDLVDAITCGNHIILRILLNHNIKINWNQSIGEMGDSLMMKLARDPQDFNVISEYITMKDSDGLPIFKINHENSNHVKLIDIFKSRFDKEGSEHMQMINLLRKCGSAEPSSRIVPDIGLRLDIDNVHNALNEKPIKEIQFGLHQEYDIGLMDTSQIFAEIRKYIDSNDSNLRILLGDEDGQALSKALNNLSSSEKYPVVHTEHNNTWTLNQEIVLVYLAAKKIGILDKFIEVLSEMHSCEWGMLVNLYKIIQEDNNLLEFKPLIDLTDLKENHHSLAEPVRILLSKTGMSDEMIGHVVVQFFKDINDNVQPKDYSTGTELIMGCFVTIFEQMIIDTTGIPLKICSWDIKEFRAIVENFVMSYDRDSAPENSLYDIMYRNDNHAANAAINDDIPMDIAVNLPEEIVVEVIGDGEE